MLASLKNSIFKLYLNCKYRPGKIKKYIWQTKNKNISDNMPVIVQKEEELSHISNKNQIKVAALQLKMKLYKNPLKFADKMEEMVCKASKEGVRLIVFPEDNLCQLLGILPGISDIDESHGHENINDNEENDLDKINNNEKNNEYYSSKVDIDEILSELGDGISISDILAFIGPFIQKLSMLIFSELAKKYKVFIMAGSGLFPDGNEYIIEGCSEDNDKNMKDNQDNNSRKTKNNEVFNIAYLFDPDGKLLGKQKKNHLLPLEDTWGLKSGEELSVFSTEIGWLAFPICMDATYFETFHILSSKGAEIVMIPIANPDANYNYWTSLRGIWGRVQESPVYGIKSAMVGNFLGFKLTGQAGVYAPLSLTAKQNGIIAESDSYDCEEIVFANLDLNLLREYRQDSTMEVNKEFEEKYLPNIYN